LIVGYRKFAIATDKLNSFKVYELQNFSVANIIGFQLHQMNLRPLHCGTVHPTRKCAILAKSKVTTTAILVREVNTPERSPVKNIT
jgi:hypothetical protein